MHHVGIVVYDLADAVAFFATLGPHPLDGPRLADT
jgi:hypothetical protein